MVTQRRLLPGSSLPDERLQLRFRIDRSPRGRNRLNVSATQLRRAWKLNSSAFPFYDLPAHGTHRTKRDAAESTPVDTSRVAPVAALIMGYRADAQMQDLPPRAAGANRRGVRPGKQPDAEPPCQQGKHDNDNETHHQPVFVLHDSEFPPKYRYHSMVPSYILLYLQPVNITTVSKVISPTGQHCRSVVSFFGSAVPSGKFKSNCR